MSNFWKRGIVFGIILCILGVSMWHLEQSKEEAVAVSTQTAATTELNLWYTDASLLSYLEEAKTEYQNKKGITLNLKQVSSMDYVETINEETLKGSNAPDVFIASNADLQTIYMAGLALENTDITYANATYPKTALDAVTYDGKIVAYPFYYETSFLLYNKNYVTTAPKTMDEIKSFADNFEAKDGLESIIKWDVSDVFLNYFTIANYANLSQEADGKTVISKQNLEQLKNCLTYYQGLSQEFAVDLNTVTYEGSLQEFFAGKSVFTIAKTDVLPYLQTPKNISSTTKNATVAESTGEASTENGEVQGIKLENTDASFTAAAPLPNLTADLQAKGLSVTYAAVVNGYTKDTQAAQELAKFLTDTNAAKLYDGSGKMSCRLGTTYANDILNQVFVQYQESISVPKLMDSGDFWLRMEIALNNIWNGESVEEQLANLESSEATQE